MFAIDQPYVPLLFFTILISGVFTVAILRYCPSLITPHTIISNNYFKYISAKVVIYSGHQLAKITQHKNCG